jgi:hypothetical protein
VPPTMIRKGSESTSRLWHGRPGVREVRVNGGVTVPLRGATLNTLRTVRAERVLPEVLTLPQVAVLALDDQRRRAGATAPSVRFVR